MRPLLTKGWAGPGRREWALMALLFGGIGALLITVGLNTARCAVAHTAEPGPRLDAALAQVWLTRTTAWHCPLIVSDDPVAELDAGTATVAAVAAVPDGRRTIAGAGHAPVLLVAPQGELAAAAGERLHRLAALLPDGARERAVAAVAAGADPRATARDLVAALPTED